jgi:hypothetical protein
MGNFRNNSTVITMADMPINLIKALVSEIRKKSCLYSVK